MESPDEIDVSECCTDIYSHPLVLKLLNGKLHPGGLVLSALMAEKMSVKTNDHLLDVACGDGKTAIYLSNKYKCSVSGIDASPVMIEKGNSRVEELNLQNRVSFMLSYASKIPYNDSEFSGVYSECSLCTFPDKKNAVQEIHRVLRDNGRFGLNDVTIEDHSLLDEGLQNIIGRALCVADAISADGYKVLIEEAGFRCLEAENFPHLLKELVDTAWSNARVLMNTYDSCFRDTLQDALSIIEKVQTQIELGNIDYSLFIFEKI